MIRLDRLVHSQPKCFCGLPVLMTKDSRHPCSATRDHILPKKLGGGNSSDNLRTAHRFCNNIRGSDDLDPRLHPKYERKVIALLVNEGIIEASFDLHSCARASSDGL